MGNYVFKLPDIGEGTVEAEIITWHVQVGDEIQEDQNLFDVMTDKATVEMTSPVSGKVIALHGKPGEMVSVGAPLVEIEVEGADVHPKVRPVPAVANTKPQQTPQSAAPIVRPEASPIPAALARAVAHDGKLLASPAVRQRAHQSGVALQFVHGSGPAGRITQADLDAHLASGGLAVPRDNPRRERVESTKIMGLRRKIAEKMEHAHRRIPHFAYVEEIDMTELESLRAHLNATRDDHRPKLNVIPFLMRALAKVQPEFPQMNARFDDETGTVHCHAGVHIGIAMQTIYGLIVPVVRHAEALDIWQSAAEVVRVTNAVRENMAAKDDLAGSTITITSLGAIGGIMTMPVINHPEVAIISPNAIIERPVVHTGKIVARKMMNLSSCYDHRVIDGYDAAQFIQRIKSLLEYPATLFMD